MDPIITESLEDFLERLRDLELTENARDDEPPGTVTSSLLFRGQADSNWTLETTLERYTRKQFELDRYRTSLNWIRRVVETALSASVPADETPRVPDEYGPPPGYEFMIYARHHGFPSPLLDWTRSPYIALYFAFESAAHRQNDHVSLYVFHENIGYGKGIIETEPHIIGLGPSVRTHRRHFTQQCEYTICKRYDGAIAYYAPHDAAFAKNHKDQDLLWKFLIPRSERAKAMSYLDRMNINEYALFNTEDALVKTIAERVLRPK